MKIGKIVTRCEALVGRLATFLFGCVFMGSAKRSLRPGKLTLNTRGLMHGAISRIALELIDAGRGC